MLKRLKGVATSSTTCLFVAGLLCFLSTYLSELALGAVATIPFILFLPGIAYLIYHNPRHIAGLCALSAFIFKFVFSNDLKEIILFTLFCTILGTVSVFTFKCIFELIKEHRVTKASSFVFPALFAVSLVIYFIIYGTIFGNLSSKAINKDYLEKNYPEETFLIGNTYYSVNDGCYVTEVNFNAKESYTALVSAEKNGSAVIDGYRDYSTHEILSVGLEKIRTALSSFVYEGSDFVIRYGKVDTSDKLTPKSSYSDYAGKTNYEIALYYQFANIDDFEIMCKSYMEHIKGFDSIVYGKITFYGFDNSNNDDFTYMATYNFGSDKPQSGNFDTNNYSRYFSEKDTHKYWELLG